MPRAGAEPYCCSLFHESEEETDDVYDLAQMTMGCGRRGDALKMAFAWVYYGRIGYERMLFIYVRASPGLRALLSLLGSFRAH
jgi:hypothetical protein